MTNFALIGAAGYIAPRHMRAIRDVGGDLVAIYDPNDSVGIIDSFFPEASYFSEFERFDRHIDKLRRREPERALSYVSVCSPNYLHDSHVRFALRSGANAICEKPLVVNPWNLDALAELEQTSGHKISSILQLRLHPEIMKIRDQVRMGDSSRIHDVDLTYITSRGKWYLQSWKGDPKKSGGIAANIGVHLFDMLHFIFGDLKSITVHQNDEDRAAGLIEYSRARVRWLLSLRAADLPPTHSSQRTFRSILVDGNEIEFSDGFTDLHTRSYEEILAGRGFGIDDNRCAIETVARIRGAAPVAATSEYHPLLRAS